MRPDRGSAAPRWLRLLLLAYPASHRKRFAGEIAAMTERLLADCPAPRRPLCALRLAADLARNALAVRRDARHARSSPGRPGPSPRKEPAMSGLLGDLKTALLSLRRSPGFTAVALLMMALAIAATTATFSLVDAILLRPLPYHQPERLVQLWESNPEKGWVTETASPANVLDWRERGESFEDIGFSIFFQDSTTTLSGEGDPVSLSVVMASGNLFSVLGAEPAAGRFFEWEETWDGGEDPVVISHALWRNRFDADPAIVGAKLTFDGSPYTVIGVAPRGFRLPEVAPDVWMTPDWALEAQQQDWFRRAHFLHPIARLAPGVDVESARAELERIAAQLQEEHPILNRSMGAGLTPLHEWVVGDTARALWILLGAVGSVLLVACVNLAHLLLARASDRRPELETRRAMGATAGRLLAPLLFEALAIGAAAGALGVAGAYALVRFAKAYGPADVPRLWEATVDQRALAVALAVGLVTSLLCAAAPARAALRANRLSPLATSRVGSGQREHRTHRLLVAAEVALAMLLVVCAGALLRSLHQIGTIDAGFDTDRALAVTVQLPVAERYRGEPPKIAYYEELAAELAALPGVEATGLIDHLPVRSSSWTTALTIEGMGEEEGFVPEIQHRAPSPGYFPAMGVEIVAGRDFREGDEDLPAAILNRTTVERHFADVDPIGRRVKMARPHEEATWLTVVGVVEDEKQDDLRAAVEPQIYRPFRSDPDRQMTVVLRTSADPERLHQPIREVVRSIDPAVPIRAIESMETVIRGSLARERFLLALLGGFAASALLLAAIGIYGVLAYWVSRRRREMGIRHALGAGSGAIARLVVGQSMGAVIAGAVLGLVAAAGAARWLDAILYEVSPTAPAALLAVTAVVLVTGLVASTLPVRRALRVDPQQALRAD